MLFEDQSFWCCVDSYALNKVEKVESWSWKSLPQMQVSIINSVYLQSITETMIELTQPTEDDTSVLEDETSSLVTFPIRETCPVCEATVAVESLNYGTCLNGHRWPRCSVSFTVCTELAGRRCQDCNSCVSTPSVGSSRWLRGLFQSTAKCPFCFGFFH